MMTALRWIAESVLSGCKLLLRLMIVVMSLASFTTGSARAFDIAAVDQGVVRIVSQIKPGQLGIGTGFLVNADGIILTNWHVVANGRQLVVLKSGSTESLPAQVLWQSQEYDLAILRVAGLTGQPVTISTIEPVRAMQVFAVGFPGVADRLGAAVEATVTEGILGRRFTGSWLNRPNRFPILQHSASINPGNSGGPLFDACGRVVGVNTQGSGSGRIIRDERGEVVDIMAGTGVFFASDISVALYQLQQLGIAATTTADPCDANAAVTEAKTQAEAAGEAAKQATDAATAAQDRADEAASLLKAIIVWVIALTGGIAVLAVVALRKPRQMVMNQVAGMSRRVMRSGPPPAGHVPPAPHYSAPSAAPQFRLSGRDPGGRSLQIAVPLAGQGPDPAGLVLGRDGRFADIVLEDGSISRRHLRLAGTPSGVLIEDLNSTNGSDVNGARLTPFQPHPLRPGDRVRLGQCELVAQG